MAKYLILNADDFGRMIGFNRGIVRAFEKGVLKSASLVASGLAFVDAVEKTKLNPGLDIGIHLTLVEGVPVEARENISTLLANNGEFFGNYRSFALRYFFGRISKHEIERELDAQFKKLIENGIRISHIDSHQHIHFLPGILEIVLRLAKKYGVNKIRCPRAFIPLLIKNYFKDLIPACVLNFLCFIARQRLEKEHFISPDWSSSFSISKMITKERFRHLLTCACKDGVYEIICHPAESDAELLTLCGYWGYDWDNELQVLTSDTAKEDVVSNDFSLIGYSDL